MSDIENNTDSDESNEVIEIPIKKQEVNKKKVNEKQKEAGLKNLKKAQELRREKIIKNDVYAVNPFLEWEKSINANTHKEEDKKPTYDFSELERKIDTLAQIHEATNRKVNKLYEIKKAKIHALASASQKVNNEEVKSIEKKHVFKVSDDIYTRALEKAERKIKRINL